MNNINDKNTINNNRSFLAMTGQRSLLQNVSKINAQKIQPNKSQIISKTNIQQKQKQNQTRKLMMKLTLPRLRKMQALVRGFIVRRKIYPPKLQQYLLAKSLMNLIISNVIYRQASQIILQNITYLKYTPQNQHTMLGVQKILQNQICNNIFNRIFQKQIKNIVQISTAQYAKLLTRPKITYGFNLRDPLQLLLYDIINNFIGMNYKQLVRQAIQQCVDQNRQLRIIDDWIIKYNMLNGLFQEIVNQALNQSIGDYIVENMLNRICIEGAEVVARVCFDQQIELRKQKSYGEIQNKMIEWILQEGALKSIVSLGHSINK